MNTLPLSPFMTTHIREPTHLSINSNSQNQSSSFSRGGFIGLNREVRAGKPCPGYAWTVWQLFEIQMTMFICDSVESNDNL